jgi:hypothetical protein
MNQTQGFNLESSDGHVHPLHSLLIIEKAINFLAKKLSRFKFKNFDENIPDIKKILNVKDVDYGSQLIDKNFLIWKFKHKSKWKVIGEFNPETNTIKIEISVRRKLNMIIGLIKIPLFENICKFKDNFIYPF